MTKQRITLVVDNDQRGSYLTSFDQHLATYGCVTIEKVEDIPEPIVEEFRVKITSPEWMGSAPLTGAEIRVALCRELNGQRQVTVERVD